MRILSREKAKRFLEEAEILNPGPWVKHSQNTALAAELIAKYHPTLDSEKAYVLGYIHDIGRREGIRELHHVIAGFEFLKKEGFVEEAKICLTHSFMNKCLDEFNGELDCSDEEVEFLIDYFKNVEYDEYDRLIQLCDFLALPEGFCIIEKRMVDVALRRGVNAKTIPKWKKVFEIKQHFEEMISKSIYELLPGIVETTFRF